MEIKKIIVYTENYLPSIGGLENNTLLLCESLISLGFLVTLISPQKDALKHDKFGVIESSSLTTFLVELQKNDFLIVNGGVSFKIIIPALIARKPYIIIYQMATLFNDTRNNNIKTWVLNRIRKTMASFALRNIGVSEYSFLELQQVFSKKKSGLLINPADPIFNNHIVHTKSFSTPFQCLFAGRLIKGKGIRLLIEAVGEINKGKPIIHLHVVGDGPEKQFVIDQSNTGYIFYHEPVAKEKLRDWLSSVHLTVIPSTHHIEGSPLIMAESLMMETPVLVSSQPAMVASIKNINLIFESGDLSDLVTKLNFLTYSENYISAKKYGTALSTAYSYSNYLINLKSIVNV